MFVERWKMETSPKNILTKEVLIDAVNKLKQNKPKCDFCNEINRGIYITNHLGMINICEKCIKEKNIKVYNTLDDYIKNKTIKEENEV